MHRDISLGNDFRKERIKLLITLATGVFALMVTFHKDLFSGHATPESLSALLVGFVLLLLSILFGIRHFQSWEDYYLAHRGLSTGVWRYHTAGGNHAVEDAAIVEFNQARARIAAAQTAYRHYDRLQSGLLIAGLLMIVLYVALEAFQPTPVAAHGTPAANPPAETPK